MTESDRGDQPTDDAEAQSLGIARLGPVRRVRDESGTLWTVREILATTYDRRDARSLVFMSDDAMRRVRNYPPDWHTWADADLYTLSLGR